MTATVVSVGIETPVPDVARLLVERGISGVPVVDMHNRVVGMITEGDLLRRTELGTQKRRGRLSKLFVSNVQLASEYLRAHGRTAADVMTHDVIQVSPDTPVGAIVDILEKNHIKRVPVIDNDQLVGIVSRRNLLHALGAAHDQINPPSKDDRDIRDQLLAEFDSLPWCRAGGSNVVVVHGVVHLWGLVRTPEEQAALRVTAEAVPGVRGVEDHTLLIRDDWRPRPRRLT